MKNGSTIIEIIFTIVLHHSFSFALMEIQTNSERRSEEKRIIFRVDKIYVLPFFLIINHPWRIREESKSSSVTTIFYLPLCTISHFPIKSAPFWFDFNICVHIATCVSFRSRRSLEFLNRTQIIWMLTFIHSFKPTHTIPEIHCFSDFLLLFLSCTTVSINVLPQINARTQLEIDALPWVVAVVFVVVYHTKRVLYCYYLVYKKA